MTITHSKVSTVADWDQQKLDQAISQGLYPSGTRLSDIVLPSDWNSDHTASAIDLTGTDGNGFFGSLYQTTVSALTGGIRIFAEAAGKVGVMLANGYKQTLDFSVATAARNFYFPDVSGQVQVSLTNSADTYANIVSNFSGAAYTGCIAVCNNIGFFLTRLRYTGTHWSIENGRTVLDKLTLSVYIAPTFTGTTNGAITFGTAFGSTHVQCYMYYAANSLVSGQAAGFYYTVMSSTTAATVYNNVYTPAAGVRPSIPSSLTAFSGAVPGGAGVSGSEITCFITTAIPGGLLSYYGSILSQYYCESNGTANNKTFRIKLASTNIGASTVASSSYFGGTHICQNMGSVSYQKAQGILLNNTTSGVTLTGLVNTANDQSITITAQTNSATDWAGWSLFNVDVGVNS